MNIKNNCYSFSGLFKKSFHEMTWRKKVRSVTGWEPTEIWGRGGWRRREEVAPGLACLSEKGTGWGTASKTNLGEEGGGLWELSDKPYNLIHYS